MAYTTDMEHCCQSVADANEFPSDQYVKSFVGTARLLLRISETFSYSDIGNNKIHGERALEMATEHFRNELEILKAETTLGITGNGLNPSLILFFSVDTSSCLLSGFNLGLLCY